VRLILFPLTWKQYKSAGEMQAIQPQIKELQKKYKNDRGKLQQETMKLYQEHRVNPFARARRRSFSCRCSSPHHDPRHGLPARGQTRRSSSLVSLAAKLGEPDPYYILLVIYIVTQLISTELMLTPQTDKTQKMMMRAMPIML
jgi:YidC/Oxa1 family membrane protein insertase